MISGLKGIMILKISLRGKLTRNLTATIKNGNKG